MTYAIVAYVLWGLFPYYFSLLDFASPLEIVAERVTWCFVFLLIVLAVRRSWAPIYAALRDPRRLVPIVLAAAVIVANWLTYNWAVNNNQAVEGALGYFINPLLTVALGVVVLKERLRRAQWVAVGIAFAAVVVLTIDAGHLPWIALVLAGTFGTYGFIMKFVRTPPVEALTIGMGAMVLPSIGVLLVLQSRGTLELGHGSGGQTALLLGAGIVTAVPMLFFNAAAQRVPLSTMGLLQYINPVLQFLVSVLVLGETLSRGRWAGFALVWVALVILAVDGLRASGRGQRGRDHETTELLTP